MENKECAAKPNKIVAGLGLYFFSEFLLCYYSFLFKIEPENTNAMLNAIYRCAVSGQDSKPYV